MIQITALLPALLLLAPGTLAAPTADEVYEIVERSPAPEPSSEIFARGSSKNQCKSTPSLNSYVVDWYQKQYRYNKNAYQNGGNWYCGYGHRCNNYKCKGEGIRFPISKNDAEYLLKKDLKYYQSSIPKLLDDDVSINDYQYTALCLAAYDVGYNKFSRSKVLQQLNRFSTKHDCDDVDDCLDDYLGDLYSSWGGNKYGWNKGSKNSYIRGLVKVAGKSGYRDCLPCSSGKNGGGSGGGKGGWNNDDDDDKDGKGGKGGNDWKNDGGKGGNDGKNDGGNGGKGKGNEKHDEDDDHNDWN